MRTPSYIRKFMGKDFRKAQGVDQHFIMWNPKTQVYCEDFADKVKNMRGCYIISSTTRNFEYANGKKSPILYIGLSDKLYKRLHDDHFVKHLKRLIDNPNFGLEDPVVITQVQDKYQYMYYAGARVDIFYCKGVQNQKEFESRLIASFYETYRSMPVGNGARSFSQK